MKKRFLFLFMMGALAAGVVACGANEPKADVNEDTQVEAEDKTDSSSEKEEEEATEENTDEDVSIEVVENVAHSDEFNERFDLDERVGANYIKNGDSEVTEFGDWKDAYQSLVNDMQEDGMDTKYALIYVNEDEIPELAYYSDDNNIIIASYADGYLNLFSSKINALYCDEKNNACLASEAVEASLNDYVVAIKDGYWVEIAYGTRRPLDEWAEDSFDENGNPIISYWEINEEELKSQKQYDETLAKYYDVTSQGKEVKSFVNAEDILSEIDSL